MLENLVRVTLYVIVGTVLFGLNIWFLRSLQSEFAEQRVVIAPFHVIGNANSESQLTEPVALISQGKGSGSAAKGGFSKRSLISIELANSPNH